MDLSALLQSLVSMDNPVLPSLSVTRIALPLAWAVLLGCAALGLAGRWSRPYRWGLCAGVMGWTLLAGALSPAHWLGLAFQSPSAMIVFMGLGWLAGQGCRTRGAAVPVRVEPVVNRVILAGVLLGWVLLLDTLAWWPVSVYAWGFSASAVGVVAGLVVLFWAVSGSAGLSSSPGQPAVLLPLCVLLFFVLTRLPTGNVWDALLDPWLWVALQGHWLFSAVRRRWAGRVPPATRA